MIILLGYFGGLAAFLVATVLVVRRSERRLGGDTPGASAASRRETGDPVSAYLDRMTAELRLPAADVSEVRAELADHLADSIASLEAEGLETDGAIREALARLGSADELARQLRAAHQSTRRLLAGVGGGVFAGAGGFVIGYFGGSFLLLLLALVVYAVAAVLSAIGIPLPDLSGGDRTGGTVNSLLLAFSVAIAAGTATRYAVRTSAGLSRHAPRSVAGFWAVALGLGFGAFALFGVRGPQTWPGVAAEACIPVVSVGAALVRIDRPMPHVGRWALVLGLLSIVGSLLMLGALSVGSFSSSSSSDQAVSYQLSDLHYDTVAPAAPTTWLPNGSLNDGGWSWSDSTGTGLGVSTVAGEGGVPPAAVLANWDAIRFEAWHMVPFDKPGPPVVDTHYSSPFAVQPATRNGTDLSAVFHFEKMRSSVYWEVFITAIGPDGLRYRLVDCGGGESTFNGSAWDWLTATQ
jgi:hypothetical protein